MTDWLPDNDLPPAQLLYWDGALWRRVPADQMAATHIDLGVAPMPTTVRQALVYHVCHGLLMRYPILDVLRFSWSNRRLFVESETCDALVYDKECS